MPNNAIATMALPLDRIPDPLTIPAWHELSDDGPPAPPNATFTPPGSKSLTNRVLPIVALASGEAVIRDALTEADDAKRMIDALRALGARIHEQPNNNRETTTLRVTGVAGRWQQPQQGITLNLNNAGTATRFLTALAPLADPDAGPITITGNDRMRQRPIAELVDMLRALGVQIDELGKGRCPPVRVHPVRDLDALATHLDIGATASSQFVSAVMMLATFLPNPVTLRFTQPPTSPAYITMTAELLKQLGATIEGDHTDQIRVHGWQGPSARANLPHDIQYDIEPDASGATYFLAIAAAIPGARVTCAPLSSRLQGDAAFVDWLEAMGARVERDSNTKAVTVEGTQTLRGIEANAASMPDAAMTLAALATLADSPTTITALSTLRVKETDRLAALRTELTKTGATVEIIKTPAGEGLRIHPPHRPRQHQQTNTPITPITPITFDTYDDHRMAMAAAVIAVVRGNARINHPACVAKTYPTFWNDLATLLHPA